MAMAMAMAMAKTAQIHNVDSGSSVSSQIQFVGYNFTVGAEEFTSIGYHRGGNAILLPSDLLFKHCNILIADISIVSKFGENSISELLMSIPKILSAHLLLELTNVVGEYLRPYLRFQLGIMGNEIMSFETPFGLIFETVFRWPELQYTTSRQVSLCPKISGANAGSRIALIANSNYDFQIGTLIANITVELPSRTRAFKSDGPQKDCSISKDPGLN
jgi:hypothetical protein